MNCRWKAGRWFGIRKESAETVIGTKEGVIKVRTTRRRAGDRLNCDIELLRGRKGLPWKPVPGRDSIEPPIKIGIPEEDKKIMKPVDTR